MLSKTLLVLPRIEGELAVLRKVAIVSLPVVLVAIIGTVLVVANTFRAPVTTAVKHSDKYHPGDTVIVIVDRARLRIGNDVIATVAKGTTMRVVEAVDRWVGGRVDVDGITRMGWIVATNVARADNPEAKESNPTNGSGATDGKATPTAQRAPQASQTSRALPRGVRAATDSQPAAGRSRGTATVPAHDVRSPGTVRASAGAWRRLLAEMKRGKRDLRTSNGGAPSPVSQPEPSTRARFESPHGNDTSVPDDRSVDESRRRSFANRAPRLPAAAGAGPRTAVRAARPAGATRTGTTEATPTMPAPAARHDFDVQLLLARSIDQIEQADRSARIGKLTLAGSQFTDGSLKYLAGLHVRMLSIDAPSVTNSGLKYVKQVIGLRYLRLWSPRFSDGALTHLSSLRDLEVLDLEGTGIAGDRLDLLAALPKLHALTLGPLTQDAVLDQLAGFPSLDQLDLRACARLTEASFDRLTRLKHLRALWLPSRIAAKGRSYVHKQLSECHVY